MNPNQPVSVSTYRTEATVTIKLLGGECDGKVEVVVDNGHLRPEDVLALAMKALAEQFCEWLMPTPVRQ
jgi:hypothetical protein